MYFSFFILINWHVLNVGKKYSKEKISDVSEHLNERKSKMESLFSNIFTGDEVLSELYEQFFNCPAGQWSVHLNYLANKLIIQPRKAVCLDGPVYLQDNQIDESIVGNIYKYLKKLRTNLMNDKSLQKHQRIAFRAILHQFSLFVR